MLITISPAKTLDFESPLPTAKNSQPAQLDNSHELIDILRGYSAEAIGELMKISPALAQLNKDRYASWQTPFDADNARPSIFAFKGDVYTGIDIDTFNQADLDHAQTSLRILSGLYGVLRPLDLMQPYRLEMGTRLDNPRGKDLYAYWGQQITDQLNEQLRSLKAEYLINLASNEYFRSVKTAKLNAEVITPVFKDYKNGQYKIISFYAKKARGLMTAWIIQNRVNDIADLSDFDAAGYYYDDEQSSPTQPVFLREPQNDD